MYGMTVNETYATKQHMHMPKTLIAIHESCDISSNVKTNGVIAMQKSTLMKIVTIKVRNDFISSFTERISSSF